MTHAFRSILVISFIFTAVCCLQAQSASEADNLFNNRQYTEALEVYKQLLQKTPSSALYRYRYARCLYETGQWDEAITQFEKAGERYALRNFYLGELYIYAYRFQESIDAYNKYKAKLDKDDPRHALIEQNIQKAMTLDNYMQRTAEIIIVDSIIIDKDKFLDAYKLSIQAGKLSANSNATQITYTNQRNDRKHFSIFEDSTYSIMSSQKLLDSWSKPTPLPKNINTHNTNYPFVMSDGITMYYATDGGNDGMGGYDIYITRYNSATDSYLNPENVGMPVNSPYNDYMLAIDEVNNIGWFATDRRQPEGKVIVYSFIQQTEKKYIKTNNQEYLRKAAQLLIHKTGTPKTTLPVTRKDTSKPKPQTERKLNFPINATTVYHSIDEFKSEQAKQLFTRYLTLQDSITTTQQTLNQLRKEFTQDKEQQSPSAQKILQLEKLTLNIRQQTKKTELQIRQLENQAIGNTPQP